MKKEKLLTIIIMVCISVLLVFIFYKKGSKNEYSNEAFSKDGFYFDTYVRITLYDCKENASISKDFEIILNECLELCSYYENIYSPTAQNSELYQLNNNPDYLAGKTCPISGDLEDIINRTIKTTVPFNNKFSIYSGDLCALWDFTNKKIPSSIEINNALENINNKPTSITLGASAKGYIADKIADYLKEQGINEALIDLGGNILALGDKYNDQLYGIGIKKPFDNTGDIIVSVKVGNKSVVTSGIYERYFEENGQIYHHIIDLETGYPTDNDILSVTIISDSSFIADCYSTGCLLIGKDYSLNLINSKEYEDVECIIIDKNYNIHLSDGLIKKDGFVVIK